MKPDESFGFTPFHFLAMLVVLGIAATAIVHWLFGWSHVFPFIASYSLPIIFWIARRNLRVTDRIYYPSESSPGGIGMGVNPCANLRWPVRAGSRRFPGHPFCDKQNPYCGILPTNKRNAMISLSEEPQFSVETSTKSLPESAEPTLSSIRTWSKYAARFFRVAATPTRFSQSNWSAQASSGTPTWTFRPRAPSSFGSNPKGLHSTSSGG